MAFSRSRVLLQTLAMLLVTGAGWLRAHTVPEMTLEAAFAANGHYTLAINVDPRTFMAADPTTLPPVPAAWYRDQTQEQIAATHQKARDYLGRVLTLVFSGNQTALPACQFQAINGANNAPMDAQTEEVHLLATAHGTMPKGGGTFVVNFAKEANTPLILLTTLAGKTAPRAQVIFPGETSREVILVPQQAGGEQQPSLAQPGAPSTAASVPPAPAENRIWLMLVAGVALVGVVIGWRLLARYRHHHRFHAKPRSM